MRFQNRQDAGRQLGRALSRYASRSDVLILALPRGGVPVAYEVATALAAPLDLCLVRKLGVPGHDELAMGAVAAGGIEVLHHDLIRDLGVPAMLVAQVAARERLELERRDRLYRAGRPPAPVKARIVIVVDDGLATGATMQAAVIALRQQGPARIVVAVPVGARESCEYLGKVADEVVCLSMPEPFQAVGLWYEDFSQTTDEEVRSLLAAATPAAPPALSSEPAVSQGGPPPPLRRAAGRAADPAVAAIRRRACVLGGDPAQYDRLIDEIGEAPLVLIGEATHGTHEFYRERAFITRRLITEKHFTAVAVEADWPDAYRINRFVRREPRPAVSAEADARERGSAPEASERGRDQTAVEALGDFGRFPTWMWRNADVLDFVGWLRTHNDERPEEERTGFYGLDLYSLRASMQTVLQYLDKVDPAGAARARSRYGCFDRFGDEMQGYGYAAGVGLQPSCERDVIAQLLELHRRRADYASRDGRVAADEFFHAEQNARLVRDAEAYYRAMFGRRAESWNLRDRHMVETLSELQRFLERRRPRPRVVVWAHNSHLGDASATDMAAGGELNVGQLVREQYGAEAVLVGFTTFSGSVTAAQDWDGPANRRHVRPALPGSYERLFHDVGIARFLLPLRTDPELASVLEAPRLERAIGVLYKPETERQSHYFHARLARQFDYVLHIDETRAVEPLERDPLWDSGEVEETYPFGL